MKIAIINSAQETIYPISHNNIGYWSQQVARQLGNSAEITLVGRRTGDERRPTLREDGVNYRFIRSGFSYGLSAARAARKLQANLIHIHEDVRTIAAVRILNPGVPIVLHTNREDIAERSMAKWVKRCKLVLTSSKQLRDRIRAAHPQFADRITTVYNGVDTALFRPVPVEQGVRAVSAPSAKLRREAREANVIDQTVFATIVPMPDSRKARLSQTILYVGDFSAESGIHSLIDAFSQIAPHVPQAMLELVEQTTAGRYDAQQLKAEIPRHLKKRIIFRKPLATDKLLAAYQSSAIVVNAGISSGYNMSVAEGGACGKPAIVTSANVNAGVVVDGETGFIIEPGDIHLLAQSMGVLLQDVEEQARMGRNARVRVKYLYAWDEVAMSLQNAYQRAAGSTETRRAKMTTA